MKHALFATREEAESYVPTVQAAVDAQIEQARAALMVHGAIEIMPAYIDWMGKWAVTMPVDCEARGEIVETVERPPEEFQGE